MAKINEEKYKNVILFFANKIKNGTLGKLKMMKLYTFWILIFLKNMTSQLLAMSI